MTDPLLIEFLGLRGESCPRCRGTINAQTARCLRCGTTLQLALTTERPFAVAWAVALAGAGIAAGFGLIVTCLIIARGGLAGFTPSQRFGLVTVLAIAVPSAAALSFLLLRRRSFIRLRIAVQWIIASLFLFFSLFLFLLFALGPR